jgi:hypothetical protein
MNNIVMLFIVYLRSLTKLYYDNLSGKEYEKEILLCFSVR